MKWGKIVGVQCEIGIMTSIRFQPKSALKEELGVSNVQTPKDIDYHTMPYVYACVSLTTKR